MRRCRVHATFPCWADVELNCWICQSCCMDLSKLLHVFLALCQTKPSWSLTKILNDVELNCCYMDYGFVKINTWISLNCYMDLSELIHGSLSCYIDMSKMLNVFVGVGFVKVVLRISCPLVLIESKYPMPWARCAFGNVYHVTVRHLQKITTFTFHFLNLVKSTCGQYLEWSFFLV